MSFSQALSGLNAQREKLGAIGNNIANSQTVGFKSSDVQFADVFAQSRIGLGTKVSTVLQNFGQGNIESSSRNMDLAIAGDGFFRFEQSTGEVGYSRNGQLSMTADGELVNAQGAKATGYGLDDTSDDYPFSKVVTGGEAVPLTIPNDDMPARATGGSDSDNAGAKAIYNLDASVDINDASQKDTAKVYANLTEKQDGDQPSEEIEYHYSNSFTAYDSLGVAHNVTVYFEKTTDNAWSGTTAVNGIKADNDFTLGFKSNGVMPKDGDGKVIGVNGSDRTEFSFADAGILGTGAEDLTFDFILEGTSQFANDSTNVSIRQDGYTSGSLVGIDIEGDGTVVRNFSNEQSAAAGQIVLANFRNPEGLKPEGDNLWSATSSSGQAALGAPGSGQLGQIESSAVETSNVDMAKELVDMIVSQRAYQANSQTISTQDELLQTIINL